jgi:uncharacterized protein (UPF0333 family)
MVINFYTVTSFINFLSSAILAILVILKNKRGQKNIAFFIFAGLIAMWALSYFFWQNVTDSPEKALFWCRVLGIFLIFIPPAYLHFTLAITETLEEKKQLLIAIYLFFYFFVLTDVTPIFINKVEPIMNFKYWPMATPTFSIYVFFFVVCMIYSSYLLVEKYKSASGIMKFQIKYAAIGMICALIFASTNFLPWYKISIPPLGNAIVPIYVIFMAYAITRYKLMNIKIIMKNIIIYFFFAFFLYAIFYVIAFTYKFIFGDVFSIGGYFMGLFLAPLFATILYTSSNFLSVFINKHIFISIYKYQQAIKKASYSLNRRVDADEIANIIVSTIKETLQPNGAAVLLAVDINSDKNVSFKITKNVGLNPNKLSALDYNLFSEYFKRRQGILTKENIDQLIQTSKNIKEKETKELFYKIENQLHQNDVFVCTPLKDGPNLLGLIIIDNKQYETAYSKEDFDLLETLSYYAQIALKNA